MLILTSTLNLKCNIFLRTSFASIVSKLPEVTFKRSFIYRNEKLKPYLHCLIELIAGTCNSQKQYAAGIKSFLINFIAFRLRNEFD